RLVVRREVALGIIGESPEEIAALRLALGNIAGAALGALQALNDVLLHIFALGIARARNELAVGSLAQDQVLAALRTFFARGLRSALLLLLLRRELAERPAGRIGIVVRAGHEHAERSAPQHHHLAAVLAILILLGGALPLRRVQVWLVGRVLLGKRATVLVLLVVGRACIEAAELAPLEQKRRSAQIALFRRRLLHPLDIFHVPLGVFQLFFKVAVEALQQVCPLLLALFNVVEFFFEPRRVLRIEDVGKVLDQQIAYHHSNLGGKEPSADLGHIFAVLNGGDD